MAKFLLDERFCRTRKPEEQTRIYYDSHGQAPKGFGLRVTPAGGKQWILNYYPKKCTDPTGKHGREHRITLDNGYPDWGPKAARDEARRLKSQINLGADPLCDKLAQEIAERKTADRELAKSNQTLGKLLLAYVEQLKAQGKYDYTAVENSLRRNVEKAHPAKWNAPAAALAMPDFRDIIATLVQAEKYREAQKVRAYLRAAYAAAIKAHSDAAAIPALRKFNIEANPARDVAPVTKPKGNGKAKPRKPLTLPELRCYWKRISALPDPAGAILRLHLLTGGQRLRQLARLSADKIDGDEMTLRDPKGRRTEEREHVVPLLEEARAALDTIGARPWLVSFDGGETPADPWHISQRIKEVSEAMLKDTETEEAFTGKIIRSTVETRLTQAGVSPHVLAHLLSHGLGTLQEKHYQFYDFGPEKLAALTTLRNLLTQPSGDVVPMKRRSK